jgi:hypothetical protein
VRYLYPSTTPKKERLRKGRAIGEMRRGPLSVKLHVRCIPLLRKNKRRKTKPNFLWLHFRAFDDWDVNNRKSEFKVKKKKKKKKKKKENYQEEPVGHKELKDGQGFLSILS